MGLSENKKTKIELRKREEEIKRRSLTTYGSFMDANHDALAAEYIKTGNEEILERIPDYRERKTK